VVPPCSTRRGLDVSSTLLNVGGGLLSGVRRAKRLK
jgi:hypothetical protein